MKTRIVAITLGAALVATLISAGGWYHAQQLLQESRAELGVAILVPLVALLKENERIISELRTDPYTEKDTGILEAYLAKVRRDGVAKHADMKQRLDQLAENNTAVVTLIKAYSPHGKTVEFTAEADKFRNYASAWRDRWNSVMEVFMAGGYYAASGVPFPKGFPAAVEAEIAAAQ